MSWAKVGNIQGPPGLSGAGAGVLNEIPSGAINGSNATFGTAQTFTAGTLRVYLNGLRQRQLEDYVEGVQAFTMNIAPLLGDSLIVDYSPPVASAPPVDEIYIGDNARLVALSNGVKLEVKDSGGTWIKQIEYTE